MRNNDDQSRLKPEVIVKIVSPAVVITWVERVQLLGIHEA